VEKIAKSSAGVNLARGVRRPPKCNLRLKPVVPSDIIPRMSSQNEKSAGGNYRWIICGLLLFSTTVNYMDRQVISYLKEFFCKATVDGGFGWSNSDYSNVTAFFTAFYAGMTILAGALIDKIGTKIGLAMSLIIWSIFGIANAFVGRLPWSHVLVRSAFGIGEAGNFPASIRTVAEWFPKRERALATGIFNSGSNIGAMISALLVPELLAYYGYEDGWKDAFIFTGAIGFVWLIFWFWLYETPAKQKRLSASEYKYIHIDEEPVKSEEGKPASKGAGGGSFGSLFTLKGRIPSNAFIGGTVMVIIISLFVFFITKMITIPEGTATSVVFTLLKLLGVWALLSLHVKRLHDIGKPSLLALVGIIPLAVCAFYLGTADFPLMVRIAPLILTLAFAVFLGLSKGTGGPNQFGESGKSGLMGYRQTWSFFCGKFFTDGIWWFYLFWLPDYLHKQFDMTKKQIQWPTFIVYGVAIVGSVYGGSIPMTLMKRGMAAYQARMTAMFLIALCPLLVLTTQFFGDISRFHDYAKYFAVAVICVGAAAHQAWSANLFTTVSDMFPKKSVGSVTGIGAMAGGLGGVIVLKLSGALTDHFKDTPQTAYLIMFIICGLSYLTAWGFMKALVPQHRPITDL
jgi:MFS family permease